MGSSFRFKQFEIQQDQCAMKIGTDGVLLGAWAKLQNQPNSILDVGAGTGVIALMLAQRSNAELIDAVELDDKAYQQCVDNFEASPWGDRLFCYHAGFEEFVSEMDETYDLIISNPPFFEAPRNTELSAQRQKARFTNNLSFKDLIEGAIKLLSDKGELAIVIPYHSKEEFISLASSKGLTLSRITLVRGRPESSFKRCLLQFSREDFTPEEEELIIETERHKYTPEYKALTKDFYLNM